MAIDLTTVKDRGLKRLLCEWQVGFTSSMRAQILRTAKAYAADHGLVFPDDANRELLKASKEWLSDCINYQNGVGTYR